MAYPVTFLLDLPSYSKTRNLVLEIFVTDVFALSLACPKIKAQVDCNAAKNNILLLFLLDINLISLE